MLYKSKKPLPRTMQSLSYGGARPSSELVIGELGSARAGAPKVNDPGTLGDRRALQLTRQASKLKELCVLGLYNVSLAILHRLDELVRDVLNRCPLLCVVAIGSREQLELLQLWLDRRQVARVHRGLELQDLGAILLQLTLGLPLPIGQRRQRRVQPCHARGHGAQHLTASNHAGRRESRTRCKAQQGRCAQRGHWKR